MSWKSLFSSCGVYPRNTIMNQAVEPSCSTCIAFCIKCQLSSTALKKIREPGDEAKEQACFYIGGLSVTVINSEPHVTITIIAISFQPIYIVSASHFSLVLKQLSLHLLRLLQVDGSDAILIHDPQPPPPTHIIFGTFHLICMLSSDTIIIVQGWKMKFNKGKITKGILLSVMFLLVLGVCITLSFVIAFLKPTLPMQVRLNA